MKSSLLPLLLLAAPALAGQITLESARDNTLFDDPLGALSNGKGERFFVGRTTQGNVRRGLLYFDVAAAIPAGATITSAILDLRLSRDPPNPGMVAVDVHRVTADWGEGSSNAQGTEGQGADSEMDDATWLHTFYPASNWSNPGGDFDPAPRASITVQAVGDYSISGPGLAADVQSFLDDPALNFGWLIKAANENALQSARRFNTREFANNPSFRPMLRIEFDAGDLGTAYCVGAANSTGSGASILALGSAVVADNSFSLRAEGLPATVPGLFFFGPNQVQAPFGDGFRCVGGVTRRIQPPIFASGGVLERQLDLSGPPASGVLVAGSDANFQCWYRDPMGPLGSGFNLTDGRNVAFQ